MNKYTHLAEAVKERVTVCDAIAMYAPNPPPRRHRIPCPIHNGKDANLWFCDDIFHCFVCGAGGDVIAFVQEVFNLGFRAAIHKINADFELALPISRRPTLREQRDAEKRHAAILEERKRQEEEKQAYEKLYWGLWDEWFRLNDNRETYAPKDRDQEWHPLFVEAIHKIDYQSYLIDTLL